MLDGRSRTSMWTRTLTPRCGPIIFRVSMGLDSPHFRNSGSKLSVADWAVGQALSLRLSQRCFFGGTEPHPYAPSAIEAKLSPFLRMPTRQKPICNMPISPHDNPKVTFVRELENNPLPPHSRWHWHPVDPYWVSDSREKISTPSARWKTKSMGKGLVDRAAVNAGPSGCWRFCSSTFAGSILVSYTPVLLSLQVANGVPP